MDICLIPARENSKRIKNKNIIKFFNSPMISYPIKTALKSKLFDKVIVSTDSKKISRISKQYGAETPFLRPKKIARDNTTVIKVIEHTLSYFLKKKQKINFLCVVYPCNPLLKVSTLKQCRKILIKSKAELVMTVAKYSYPIQRALEKRHNGNYEYREKKNKYQMSHNLQTYYQDAGQCYWYNFKKISNLNSNISIKAVELKEFQFKDVDNISDLNSLKKIYKHNLYK